MQRLLYNTARNLSARQRIAAHAQATAASTTPKPATAVSGAGDRDDTVVIVENKEAESSQVQRSTHCFNKASNAYERAVVLMQGGVTLGEFRDDLQRSMNVWMQSNKLRQTKKKVEELLVVLEGTQENGPWNDIVEEWKPHLLRLPANM